MVFSRVINGSTQFHGANASIKSKAKELRKKPTPTEKKSFSPLGETGKGV
jgi:hypothetical protein